MPAKPDSLDAILEEVRSVGQIQLRHFEALDTKAGIVLGFVGVIVALFPAGGWLIDVARVVAVLSGLLALATFWPRVPETTAIWELSELFADAEPRFTKLRLLDTHVAAAESLDATVRRKATRLKLSMVMLAFATVLASVGQVVD